MTPPTRRPTTSSRATICNTLLLMMLCACSTTTAASDNTSPYALYSLPPFTITFTSSYTTTGLPTNLAERGELLASTLHAPLQLITAEFLLESFRIEIAKHSPPSSHYSTTTGGGGGGAVVLVGNTSNVEDELQQQEESVSLETMLDSFMTLDLQVAVRSMDTEENGGQRHLQEDPVLTFQADFFTTAAFLEPNNSRDNNPYLRSGGNRPPSNEAVANLFGEWMEQAFVRDKEYYFDALTNSEDGVLRHIETLDIITNSDAVFDPYSMGTLHQQEEHKGNNNSDNNQEATRPASSTSAATTGGGKGTTQAPPNPAASSHDGSSWNRAEKLFFTVLVFVSVVSISGLLFAFKRYRRRRGHKLDHLMELEGSARGYDFGPGGVDEFSDHVLDARHSLGGRHTDEVMDILQASDRYLATHRPDLLQAMKEQEQNKASNDGRSSGIIPVATNSDTNRPAERRYVTPTNPFSYLYGASYFHSDRRAVEKDRRKHAIRSAMDGVQLCDRESVPDDEDLDLILDNSNSGGNNLSTGRVTDQSVSGYLQNWFQNLVKSRTATSTAQEGDYDEDDIVDDLVLDEEGGFGADANDGANGTEGVMACDEDPGDYTFAYQDFPRQDGTPCLIYEETLDEEQEEQFLRNSRRDSLHSTTRYGIHDTLTDDEFQQALSQHDVLDYKRSNSSFEHVVSKDEEDDDDVSNYDTADDESQAGSSTATDSVYSSSAEADPAKFTDRLERLVSMRHRHYEKQRIVEKHREQRRQERARQRTEQKEKQQQEMEERDRRLRRHSLELDIQELEAATVGGGTPTPKSTKHQHAAAPSTASKVITPTDRLGGGHQHQASWNQQQAQSNIRQLQKPKLHRRTSSEADKGLSSAAVTTPMGGIQKNRSMDLNEARVVDERAPLGSVTTSVATFTTERSVQSMRSPVSHGDIFRLPKGNASPRPTSALNNNATSSVATRSFPPVSLEKIDTVPIVSPASSFTDTGSTTAPSSAGDGSHCSSSRATPPLMMGSRSVRDGTSARKKKREMSTASEALAKGFHARRSMSFGNLEEKKVDDAMAGSSSSNNSTGGGTDRKPLPPSHPRRTSSFNRHRRSNSSSPADVMVHGIYAQFK